MTHRTFSALIVATLAVSVGCTTYINIPAQMGDVAGHSANDRTVLAVMAEAARAVAADRYMNRPFFVRLPEGSLASSYDQLVPKVSTHARWSVEGPRPDEPVMDLRQVRVRGTKAEVDVVCPADTADPESVRQVVTVTLDWDLTAGWGTKRIRVWPVGVDEALSRSAATPTVEIQPEETIEDQPAE